MRSLNHWTGMGYLTRDPELRYTPKGTAVCKLGIALNYSYRLESGEERDEVTFIDITYFGKPAETLGQFLKKGMPLIVQGRLKMESWEDKQTQDKRSKIVIMGESFNFVPTGNRDMAAPRTERPAKSAAAPDNNPPPEEDDVPF